MISQYLIVSKIGEKKSKYKKKNPKLEYPAISAFKFRISHRYPVLWDDPINISSHGISHWNPVSY